MDVAVRWPHRNRPKLIVRWPRETRRPLHQRPIERPNARVVQRKLLAREHGDHQKSFRRFACHFTLPVLLMDNEFAATDFDENQEGPVGTGA
jgi:hypothetical protein